MNRLIPPPIKDTAESEEDGKVKPKPPTKVSTPSSITNNTNNSAIISSQHVNPFAYQMPLNQSYNLFHNIAINPMHWYASAPQQFNTHMYAHAPPSTTLYTAPSIAPSIALLSITPPNIESIDNDNETTQPTPSIHPKVTSMYTLPSNIQEYIESTLCLDFKQKPRPNIFFPWMSNIELKMNKTCDKQFKVYLIGIAKEMGYRNLVQ